MYDQITAKTKNTGATESLEDKQAGILPEENLELAPPKLDIVNKKSVRLLDQVGRYAISFDTSLATR